MGWKFWRHADSSADPAVKPAIKLKGPKELSQQLGMHLVTVVKMDPDMVWNLRMVLRPRKEDPARFDFRIFDPNASEASGVYVANFLSLDDHSDLIIFSGCLDKESQQFEIH